MKTQTTDHRFRITGFVVLLAMAAALQANAFAATIILKTGQRIVTEKFWEKDDSVAFYYNDLIARIPRKEIDRIEKSVIELSSMKNLDGDEPPTAVEEPTEGENHPKNGQQTETAKSIRDTSYLSHIISAISKSKKHVGYRDLFWGCSSLDIYGLEKFGEEPDFGGIEKFVDPKRPAKFGNADVQKIVYRFWHDNLISITMWADGATNYAALKEEAFKKYGKGRQGDPDTEKYIWIGGPSDRYLEFDENSGKGLLWFRYRELWQRIDQRDPQSPPPADTSSPPPDTVGVADAVSSEQ